MNRKNLTAAVLAGLAGVAGIAGTAQAVNMNPDGLGQVLIYPYYTANDGNQTVLSVVNTTSNAKAVKVRFLEGFNSREVLDFNLYLSEYDVWVAAIGAMPGKTPKDGGDTYLSIPDTSCTVPYLYKTQMDTGMPQKFLDLAYTGAFADGGPTGIGRAAEGHFEIIEMGTLEPDSVAEANVTHELKDSGMYEPKDCLALTDWWTDWGGTSTKGIWYDDAAANADCMPYPITEDDELEFKGCHTGIYMDRSSGGLFGGAAVINPNEGTMYSYDAKALQGFDDTDDGIHFIPGTIYPSLNSGSINTSWVFFGVPQNKAVKKNYEYRGRVDADYLNPNDLYTVDAVSSVFMHDTVMNEYVTGGISNAATEWVITFPTKNFYADHWRMCESGLLMDAYCYDSDGDYDADLAMARRPFTAYFGEVYPTGHEFATLPKCEKVTLKLWDREEQSFNPTDPENPVRPPVVSPSLPSCDPVEDPNCRPDEAPFQICNEVNVLRFNDGEIFGTPAYGDDSLLLTVDNEGGYDNGWGRLTFHDDNVDRRGMLGLPVTGFAAYKFENGFVDSPDGTVKAFYGGLFGHKGNVRMGPTPDDNP